MGNSYFSYPFEWNYGNVKDPTPHELCGVGGIVGISDNGDVMNCVNQSEITSTYPGAGGVVGVVWGARETSVIGCENKGSVVDCVTGTGDYSTWGFIRWNNRVLRWKSLVTRLCE